jgi:NodT family efflux transporter outer membrane factor (OMF) lipoprotein
VIGVLWLRQRHHLLQAARPLALALACAGLAACQAPPAEVVKPVRDPIAQEMPANWRLGEGWQPAKPRDGTDRTRWWSLYADPELDRLQQAARNANAQLNIAVGRVELARTQARVAQAALSPQIQGGAAAQRLRTSKDRPLAGYSIPNYSTTQNDYNLSLQTSYEIDLFGRLRSAVQAAQAGVEQAGADLENARLLIASDLAVNYFTLRALDTEIAKVREIIDSQRKSRQFLESRRVLGIASALEVTQQQAAIDASVTQLDLLTNQRARLVDAIATLIGTPAPTFQIEPRVGLVDAPQVPVGLPSDLLERRPDVASAERAMAAANAQIGIARAAFFPKLTLTPTLGWDSRLFPELLSLPSVFWSLGGNALQTLFDGGRIRAQYEAAEVSWNLTSAQYRQTVLVAMQEVQDGIAGMQTLAQAYKDAQTAVQSARKVLELATARYEGGLGTFLDVLIAQQQLLASERLVVQIAGQQLLVSVQLIKALGGSWEGAA